jgi:hypothetical protein
MKWARFLVVISLIGPAQWAYAGPIVTNISDSGVLHKTTYASPPSNTSDTMAAPYGSSLLTITPMVNGSNISYKLAVSPSAGFLASANNLAGGKTAVFEGTLSFDIAFDAPVNLIADLFETGVYSISGANSRVSVNEPGSSSGITIQQLDDLLLPESLTSSFATDAVVVPGVLDPGNVLPAGSGNWSLAGQVSGFSKQYQKYHVVIDHEVLAEALADANPGFAAVSAKDLSLIFSFAPGGGGTVPEPASFAIIAVGCLAAALRRPRRHVSAAR